MNEYQGWRGDMNLAQVCMLEQKHAHLTDKGWVIPMWIHSLRHKILRWEQIRNQLKGGTPQT